MTSTVSAYFVLLIANLHLCYYGNLAKYQIDSLRNLHGKIAIDCLPV
jgi:hypothetical protein